MNQNHPNSSKGKPRILEWHGPGPLPPIQNANIAVVLLETMAKFGDDIAIIDAETSKQRTFSFLCTNVPRLAGGLRAAGVSPGDAVLFVSLNHIDFPLVMLSVMYCGAVFTPINPDLKADEICHMVRVSNSKWAFVHRSRLENVEAAEALLPPGSLQKVWILEGDEETHHRPTLDSLLDFSPIKPVDEKNGIDFRKTPATILFSSGTTGPPKGVMISHANLYVPFATNSYFSTLFEKGDIEVSFKEVYKYTLVITPMCHSFGFLTVIGTLMMGGAAVSLPKFSPRKYFEAIEKFKVSISPLVPHIANFLSKTPLLQEYDTSSIIAFSSTTAPLGAEATDAFMEKTGRLIAGGYGLTETLGGTSNGGMFGFKSGSVGKAMPYVKIKVIDVQTAEMLGENEEGELCVHSPGVMLRYANNPEATKAMIDAEGWVHTGDIGYFDEEDFLFITDRMKDLIKVKGFQVSPSQLEDVLLEHEHVSEAAVIGVPHGRTGEAPRAYVVPVPGKQLSEKELMEYVAKRVSSYKQLTGGLVIVESLPRNHTGKILRRKLKQDYLATQSKL